MMNLLSLSVIAGIAVGAAGEARTSIGSVERRHDDDSMTTEDLESATTRFIRENLGRISASNDPSDREKRTLRTSATASTRGGKSGKMYVGSGTMSTGAKSEKAPSGEVFYLLPSACPGQCISSRVNEDSEMDGSVEVCQGDEPTQMWLVRSDGSYVMIESYDNPGMCISVDYEAGDDVGMVAQTCEDGMLMLRDCHSVYGTEWYFTGGQLVNSFCWAAGLSSMMTIDIENPDTYKCKKDVAVFGRIDEAVLKADTFMFVNRLPRSPFYVSDVEEALEDKSKEPKTYDYVEEEGAEEEEEEVTVHFEGET